MKATQKNGEVTRLEVHGGGWGHGVGMCQVGAIGRARAGQSYRQIVDAYYSDTELLRLY
jgi:stage II sporulation protein D